MHRSFQSKWFDEYRWLHYNEAQDAAYCYTCKTANEQNKLKTKYKDSLFISRGFINWKDGTVSFTKHKSSDCHKEAVQVIEVINIVLCIKLYAKYCAMYYGKSV